MTAHQPQPFDPEGSQYETLYPPKPSKRRIKRFKKALSRLWTSCCCLLLPPLYKCWMHLVWATSRVDGNFDSIRRLNQRGSGLLAAIWHEDVFMAPRLFSSFQIYTLASTARIGRIITAVLEAHGFKVFRGGSGQSRRGRRRNHAIRNMIYYLKQNPDSIYGIAVDGTKGPAHRLKPGICKMAQECRVPVFLVHTKAKRALRLPTWDKTVVPLPFNRIRTQVVGPFWIHPEATADERESFRQHLERELKALSDHMAAEIKAAKGKSPKPSAYVANVGNELDLQHEKLPSWAGSQEETKPNPTGHQGSNGTRRGNMKQSGKRQFCLLTLFFLLPIALDALPL